jgi:hypothetical protein
MAALAERFEAFDRALAEGDLDSANRLFAEFRPKDRELVFSYIRCKLAGDEGGAARLRQHLEDCWKIERGDEAEIREVERRTGRQIIGRVPAPPAMTPPRPIAREQCGQAARPRERRGRHGARRQTKQAARDGPDLDPPPKPPAPSMRVAGVRRYAKHLGFLACDSCGPRAGRRGRHVDDRRPPRQVPAMRGEAVVSGATSSTAGRALVLLRDRRAFEGDVELRERYVTVNGRHRWRTGANYREVVYGGRSRWTFPLGVVREVRWR